MSAKANVVEDKPTPKRYEKKFDHKKKYNKFSRPNGTNPTFKKKGNCFVCEKPGHHAPQCRHRVKDDYPPKARSSDKIVMTKYNVFVGKGYCDQGFFVLNIYEIMNESESSAYIGDSYDI